MGRWFTILPAKPISMVCRETFHLPSRTPTAICRTQPRNPPIKLSFATIEYIGSVIGAVATGVLTKLRVKLLAVESIEPLGDRAVGLQEVLH
jgi:hypothetical protein